MWEGWLKWNEKYEEDVRQLWRETNLLRTLSVHRWGREVVARDARFYDVWDNGRHTLAQNENYAATAAKTRCYIQLVDSKFRSASSERTSHPWWDLRINQKQRESACLSPKTWYLPAWLRVKERKTQSLEVQHFTFFIVTERSISPESKEQKKVWDWSAEIEIVELCWTAHPKLSWLYRNRISIPPWPRVPVPWLHPVAVPSLSILSLLLLHPPTYFLSNLDQFTLSHQVIPLFSTTQIAYQLSNLPYISFLWPRL